MDLVWEILPDNTRIVSQTPDTTTLKFGNKRPFLIRNDQLAKLGAEANDTFNFSNLAATKTIVKRAKQPTPKEKLAKLLKEHQAHCQGILLGTTPLRKRTDIKQKRAAKRPRATDDANDDANVISIARPPTVGDVHTVLPHAPVEQPTVFQTENDGNTQQCSNSPLQTEHDPIQPVVEGNTPECSNPLANQTLTTPDLEQIELFHTSTARTTPCSAEKASGKANNVHQTPPPAVTLRR